MIKVEMVKRPNKAGSSLQGYFPENTKYSDLVKVFGKPNRENFENYKVDTSWEGLVDGEEFTIYNYKTGKNYNGESGLEIEDITDWHIGGFKEEIVFKLLSYFKQKRRTA